MSLHIHHEFVIPREYALQRLDQAVAALLPQYSRARLQLWIKEGGLTLDGKSVKPRDKVFGGESVVISVEEASDTDAAEDIPLEVIFEDEHILVIKKPPGLVVHPGAGNPSGTLLNALLNHAPELGHIPRAGIVHRLDKDTSGLMVIAKTLEAQNGLVQDLQERVVSRVYEAIVYGVMTLIDGTVEGAIGRHPVHRKKMAIRPEGKEARTHYRALQHFEEHTLVECRLDTGRTHQIRVHMQSLGFPLVGDPTYGGHYRRPKSGDVWLEQALKEFDRQALHAKKLSLNHPASGKKMSWQAEPPEDFMKLLDFLYPE
ncbi:MAG: 23S rRNA pseudouridine(1911/1915/1917) synthase RluD [Pseudomonadales bacterium]|nr:23S rRNA pseudouridine(1911/1915/1917) synthase RluD [Pseudomonadales bacterium]MBO6596495.1 23S rRNA pseudouridine(1911/1915/1917) synthase RluD [Pseudomonadales bacterium]MBO6822975.1 23S rRNA pseudouridine(1911/1915/1917) synthase RluD [Pseudomonadales bacterium]